MPGLAISINSYDFYFDIRGKLSVLYTTSQYGGEPVLIQRILIGLKLYILYHYTKDDKLFFCFYILVSKLHKYL